MLGIRQAPGPVATAFEGLSRRELLLAERSFEQVTLDPGDVLYRPGDEARWASLVVAGSVATGHRFVASQRRSPGRWLGLVATLRREQHSETAWALEPSELLVIGVRELRALLAASPAVSSVVLRAVADDAAEARAMAEGRHSAASLSVGCADRARGSRAA